MTTLMRAVFAALVLVQAIWIIERTTAPGCPRFKTAIRASSVINRNLHLIKRRKQLRSLPINKPGESVADRLVFKAPTVSVGTTIAPSFVGKENFASMRTMRQKEKLGKKTGKKVHT